MNPTDTEKALEQAGTRLDRAAIAMEAARHELLDAAADYALSAQAHRAALAAAATSRDAAGIRHG